MSEHRRILLAHGGGGQLMGELLREVILPAVGGPRGPLSDSAEVRAAGRRLMLTTDSYVVWPVEFPGGDIGKLSVCGTINDLAVCGAWPVALSLSLVLEEGLEVDLLRRVLSSAGAAAKAAGVGIVTGDTKVVERRGQPGMSITTTGVGVPMAKGRLGFDRVRAGDAIVLSGPLGLHGLAVMCKRKGLSVGAALDSDCAPLHRLVGDLIGRLGAKVRWMRDPTRGGLAAVLAELSAATGRNILIRQEDIPTDPTALAAAELLGLDLLTVANEGRVVAVVAHEAARAAVKVLARHDIEAPDRDSSRSGGLARRAAVIGAVGEPADLPLVEMLTRAGGRRVVQMPYGEELPRIC